MALTEGAKQYIAKYLGIVSGSQFCFSDTTAASVKYWDATNVSHMGSTVDAVSTIKMYGGYSYEDKVATTRKIDAAKLTSENGGTTLVNDDIVWIANHSDGTDKYCFTLPICEYINSTGWDSMVNDHLLALFYKFIGLVAIAENTRLKIPIGKRPGVIPDDITNDYLLGTYYYFINNKTLGNSKTGCNY